MLIAGGFDAATIATVDWLARRHGVELSCFAVSFLRFGAERLLTVRREFPPRDAHTPDPAAEVQQLLGDAAPPSAWRRPTARRPRASSSIVHLHAPGDALRPRSRRLPPVRGDLEPQVLPAVRLLDAVDAARSRPRSPRTIAAAAVAAAQPAVGEPTGSPPPQAAGTRRT